MEFIGNKKIVDFIGKILKEQSFAQAYLFSGPENTGKLFLAKCFAKGAIGGKELNFKENGKENDPTDLIVIAPEIEEKGGKKRERDISTEKVREAQREMSLFPHSGKRKVLIVNNAHKMNISAQNSLLKMLEEPNSTSIIIIISHEESKILPTIKSRCQKVSFSLVGGGEMRKMESLIGDGSFEKYEMMSMGRPGIFKSFLKERETLTIYENAYSDLDKIFDYDINSKFSYAEKMSKDSSEAMRVLNIWIWILRKRYLKNENNRAEEYYSIIEKIEEAISTIKNTNANVRLVLENLFINI